jgi:hypothetical protein
MNLKWIIAAIAGFAIGVALGRTLGSGRRTDESVKRREPVAVSASQSRELSRASVDSSPTEPTERHLVMPSQSSAEADPSAQSSGGTATQPEAVVGRFFQDVSYYEGSNEFNPARKVLTPQERRDLQARLNALEGRVYRAEGRAMTDVQTAISFLRQTGRVRSASSGNVGVAPGAVVTDVRTDQNGTTAVDLYPQDLPAAAQLEAEINAVRDEGLALVRDFFQPQ